MSPDRRRALLAVLTAALAAACTPAAPDRAPHIDRLEPAGGATGVAATVLVHGRGFYPRAVQSASGGPASLDTTQRAWLDGVALEGVIWVDEGTLRLNVPAGLALGPHELTVENGLGQRATLSGAWTVIEPAALVATARLSSPVASTGQALTLTVALRNDGGVAVQGATVAVAPSGAGAVAIGGVPAAVDVPAGGSVEVTVPITAQQAGEVALTASVLGLEAFTGRAVQAEAAAASLTVQRRAILSAALAVPTTVTAAVAFTVTMTVTNDGEVAALGVIPDALALAAGAGGALPTLTGPTPSSADVPAHGSATFTWSARLASGAPVVLSGGAAGTDANDGAPVIAPAATSNAATPQPSASLRIEDELTRSVASTAQVVGLHLTVKNTGPVAVGAIALTVGLDGAGAVTLPALPLPFDLQPGGALEVVLPLVASAAGPVAVSVSAAGAEAVTSFPISASQSAGSVTVQDRAALVASLAIPSTIPVSGAFTVTMTVFNVGGATARTVASGALSITTDATAALASLSGPSPATASIPGQGSATFTWSARLQGAGTMELQGGAAGTDANDGGAVVAAPVESNVGGQVPEVALVAADPFGDGSATGLLAVHGGQLWLGPSADGKTLLRLDPATGQTAIMGVQISVDTGGSPAENTAWSGRQTADTFGTAACAKGSLACGPGNESGRGLLSGGAALGADWLLYGGTSPNKAQNLYLASGATPAFATVDLASVLPTTTDGITASAFASDGGSGTLYVAVTDKAAKKSPYLVALATAPSAAWLDAGSSDAVELGTARMTGLGGSGALVASVDAQPRIDSLLQFRGLLYVAGGGAIWRSTVAAPRSYASHSGDWALTGPLAWSAKTSIPAASTVALTPADRAVPALVAFGTCGTGQCLYLARNVKGATGQPAVVPQLFRCDPTKSGGADACDILDWSQVVPNTSGDKNLTQLGVATRGAASVLLATSRYLYLGFDDATTGAQLFRTQAASPSAISDFQGQNGCAAGTAGCSGLGGAGLGDATTATRFLDAKAVTANGKTTVYVLAAGASGAQRLYAIGE